MRRSRSQSISSAACNHSSFFSSTQLDSYSFHYLPDLDLLHSDFAKLAMRRFPNVPRLQLGQLTPIPEEEEEKVPQVDRTRSRSLSPPATPKSIDETSNHRTVESSGTHKRSCTLSQQARGRARTKPAIPKLHLPTSSSSPCLESMAASTLIPGATKIATKLTFNQSSSYYNLQPLKTLNTDFASFAKITGNLSDESISSDEDAQELGDTYSLSDSQVEMLQAELDGPPTRRFSSPTTRTLPMADHRNNTKPRSHSDPSVGRSRSLSMLLTHTEKSCNKSRSESHIHAEYRKAIESMESSQSLLTSKASVSSSSSSSLNTSTINRRHTLMFLGGEMTKLRHSPHVLDFKQLTYDLIDPSPNWSLECGPEAPAFATPRDVTDIYKSTFNNTKAGKVLHYIGEHRTLGPVVVTISKNKGANYYNALLSTKDGDMTKMIAKDKVTKAFNRVSQHKLLKAISEELTPRNLVKTTDPLVSKELARLDQLGLAKVQSLNTFKFGLLYVKEGQTAEEDIFNNVSGSAAWEEFLEFMGDRIDLKGWQNYNGGLDVSEDARTGAQSVYRQWKNNEIMFHVSTLLPFHPTKHQQVERKRHIGNDVAILVFKDGNTPFRPDAIATQFTHVYIVVSKDESSTKQRTFYRMWVVRKAGVPCFKPTLPDSVLFEKGDEFRELLYSKLINGERAAANSEQFRTRLQRSRNMLLRDLKEKFYS